MARQEVCSVACLLHVPTIDIQLWVEVGALAWKAHPVVEARTRTVVDTHVPLAHEGSLVTVIAQSAREREQSVAGRTAIRIVGYAVAVGVLAGEEASAAGRAQWAGHEGTESSSATNGHENPASKNRLMEAVCGS